MVDIFFSIASNGYTIIAAIIAIGSVIFIHELGHFLSAKLSGVRVLQFSLGFPPKAISKKIGETEYIISWVPIGGYVKMWGENEDINEPFAFSSKSPIQKIFIIGAGPISNILAGITILWFIFLLTGEVVPDRSKTVISGVVKNSPAERIGLQKGDSIVAINGLTIKTWDELDSALSANPEKQITLVFVRDNIQIEDTVTLSSITDPQGLKRGKLGVFPTIKKLEHNPASAFKKSVSLVYAMISEIIKFLARAFTGKATLKEIGGPILIAQLAGKSAKAGLENLIIFIAILSTNLGFINLFPLPLLDGGQIILYSIEGLSRKKISAKTKEITQKIGVFVLLTIMALIMINDIIRLFKG